MKELAGHPLRTTLNRGLFATLNSDDPAYFGGYVNENYRALQQALGLSDTALGPIARNSFAASLPDDETKVAQVAEVGAYLNGG